MTDEEDFKNYVLYGVDGEDFSLDSYSYENICTSCKFFELFGEYCPCALNITCIGHDDKGNYIVVACGCYEKTNEGGGKSR